MHSRAPVQSPAEAGVPCLSVAATAQCTMDFEPAPYQPFNGPMGVRLRQLWELLLNAADRLWEQQHFSRFLTLPPHKVP
jgi:hypothetical protein